MAKKRKASRRDAQPDGPRELDPSDARLGPVSTFEDVANSEDEFHINRDALMLDDEPESKRRRKANQDDEDLEFSDAEILGHDDDDDDDDDEEEDDEEDDGEEYQRPPPSKSKKGGKKDFSDDEEGGKEADGEGEDSGWWGSSKKEYYDADNIETEADALEEEAEAKRLQKKKLAKMAEEDFIFDGDEWLAGDKEDEAEAEVDGAETITEVLKEIEITDDMGTEERSKLLAARYPEFEYLVKDFQELQPLLGDLKAEAEAGAGINGAPDASLATIKYWILGCYIASLASYFAILTSPARDAAKESKSLDPTELRDHDVMETLVRCRDAWSRIKSMKSISSAESAPTMDVDSIPPLSMDITADGQSKDVIKKKTKAKAKQDKEKKSKKLEKAAAIEEMVADLYNLPLSSSKSKAKGENKTATATATTTADDGGNSDFGEEDALDAKAAADKATRKKSLKFYTSQIVQKANRRAGAGRDAGGDMDIPHRERLRDRQARLLAEAEKRGKQGSKGGADLGDNGDSDDDAGAAKALRDEEDEYYDMVAHKAKAKKDGKAARYAAYAAASKADRVVETEEVGEDGKRKINYTIEKNKGLAPKRNKDARNPRVKRRKQFEAKQKKLKSMKPVWQGGEPKGGYKGETSGINAAVVKSTKL